MCCSFACQLHSIAAADSVVRGNWLQIKLEWNVFCSAWHSEMMEIVNGLEVVQKFPSESI